MKNIYASITKIVKKPRISTRQIVASSVWGRKNLFVKVNYLPIVSL